MTFRDIVTKRHEKVNIIPDAAPRVTDTPYPAIRRNPAHSRSTEKTKKLKSHR